MNYNNLCFRCFCEKPIRDNPCPQCGYKHTPESVTPNCLLPGTLLHNRYIVGVALGVGGFGITYKCLDTKIGGICAIKEYFPSNFALRTNVTKYVSVAEKNIERYNKIMKRFVEEAELVKSLKHRNVITIYDSFFENNTAYYVMEYCDGIDLRIYTNNFTRKLEYDEGMNLLYQVMNGLEYIHSKGILHRDIAPDNIYVTKNNTVKILDFGSARSEMDQYKKELSVIVKVGYAPIEQYGGSGKQGPYTDIYALGATFYHLFTSITPMESTQRVAEDTMEEFSRLRPDLPDNLKYCIERSMALIPAKRISSVAEMKSVLGLRNISAEPAKNEIHEKKISKRPKKEKTLTSVTGSQTKSAVASVAERTGAYAIDAVVWCTLYLLVIIAALGGIPIGLCVLFPLVFTLINTISELLCSTTLGKAMLRLQICRDSGGKASFGQVLARNMIKLLGVFVLIFAQNDKLLEDRATKSIVCKMGEVR